MWRLRVLAAAALFGFTLALWVYLRYVGAAPGDLRIYRWVDSWTQAQRNDQLLTFFGTMGTPIVATITVAVSVAVVSRSLGLRAGVLVGAAAAGVFVNDVVRATLGPTPGTAMTFGPALESYPSGHVVYATSLFGTLAWLGWHHGRRDAAIVLVGLIVAMGPARIFAGAHLTSDVIGGYALGGSWLLLVVAVFDARRRTTGPELRPTPRSTHASRS